MDLIPARASARAGPRPSGRTVTTGTSVSPAAARLRERTVRVRGDDHQQVAVEQRPVRVGVARRGDRQHRRSADERHAPRGRRELPVARVQPHPRQPPADARLEPVRLEPRAEPPRRPAALGDARAARRRRPRRSRSRHASPAAARARAPPPPAPPPPAARARRRTSPRALAWRPGGRGPAGVASGACRGTSGGRRRARESSAIGDGRVGTSTARGARADRRARRRRRGCVASARRGRGPPRGRRRRRARAAGRPRPARRPSARRRMRGAARRSAARRATGAPQRRRRADRRGAASRRARRAPVRRRRERRRTGGRQPAPRRACRGRPPAVEARLGLAAGRSAAASLLAATRSGRCGTCAAPPPAGEARGSHVRGSVDGSAHQAGSSPVLSGGAMNQPRARSRAVMGRRPLGPRRRGGRRGRGSAATTRGRTRTWTRRPATVIVARLRAASESACSAASLGSTPPWRRASAPASAASPACSSATCEARIVEHRQRDRRDQRQQARRARPRPVRAARRANVRAARGCGGSGPAHAPWGRKWEVAETRPRRDGREDRRDADGDADVALRARPDEQAALEPRRGGGRGRRPRRRAPNALARAAARAATRASQTAWPASSAWHGGREHDDARAGSRTTSSTDAWPRSPGVRAGNRPVGTVRSRHAPPRKRGRAAVGREAWPHLGGAA